MFNIKNCITRLFFIFVILRSIKVRDSSVIGVYEAGERYTRNSCPSVFVVIFATVLFLVPV